MGPQIYWGHEFDVLGLRDVIDHVTIGLGVGTFLLVVNDDQASILHVYGDTGLWRFWGHKFDLLGSRDVIGHVTIRLGVGTFLLVVNDDHAFILHGYRDTGLQRFWGHEFVLLGSHDVIVHVTIGLGIRGFLLVVHWNHASTLHRYGDIKAQSCICPCWRPKVHCACSVSRDLQAGGRKLPHIWNFQVFIAYSLYNFCEATMTIKGRL